MTADLPRLPETPGWEDWYRDQDYRRMPWFSARPSPWLVRAVRRRKFGPKGTVLDVGCGAGTNAIWLGRQGFRVVGVDLSPTATAIASARAKRVGSRAEFRSGNALDLPFDAQSFDAAMDTGCFHSLPIPGRESYARGVARVLRPDSRFLLTWIPREVTTEFGPPHRPSLAETATVFEPWFVFLELEWHASGSRGAWHAQHKPLGRCTALLARRRGEQPPAR